MRLMKLCVCVRVWTCCCLPSDKRTLKWCICIYARDQTWRPAKGRGNNPHFHIESTGSASRRGAAVGRRGILSLLFLDICECVFVLYFFAVVVVALKQIFVRGYLFRNCWRQPEHFWTTLCWNRHSEFVPYQENTSRFLNYVVFSTVPSGGPFLYCCKFIKLFPGHSQFTFCSNRSCIWPEVRDKRCEYFLDLCKQILLVKVVMTLGATPQTTGPWL